MTLLKVAKCLVTISVVIKANQSFSQMYSSGARSGNFGTSLVHVMLTAVFWHLEWHELSEGEEPMEIQQVSPDMS